ncbi:MAG TPA: hypothetical protein VHQ88_08725, partial [Burkholderiales bacterium]|nr:hypothetical protein [Burkholderiales bacterium]
MTNGLRQIFCSSCRRKPASRTLRLLWIPAYAGMTIGTLPLLSSSLAQAQASAQWPTRPIRLVHGFISGGSVDITARLL